MATIHVAAERDDVSYSHTLKKLLRVNVERDSGNGNPSRQLGHMFGQTGTRTSGISPYDPVDAQATQQIRSPLVSPRTNPTTASLMSRNQRDRNRTLKGSLFPGAGTQGVHGNKAPHRDSYHPPPDLPASFMRTAFSEPAPRRRHRRSTSGSNGSNGHGDGNGHSNGHSNDYGRGNGSRSGGTSWSKDKSGGALAMAAAHSGSHDVRRGAVAADEGVGPGNGVPSASCVSWSPHLIRTRANNNGMSNMSYKPPCNVTAEQAAAVLQRRRAAFATRNGSGLNAMAAGSPGSPGGSASGSIPAAGAFAFGGGGSGGAVAAAAAAAGAGGSLRSSWGTATGQSAQGPTAMQLLTLGLGTSLDVDAAAKMVSGGAGNGDHAPVGFGTFGEDATAGGGGGGVANSYDNIWPLANWRAFSTTAEGDGDVSSPAIDGPSSEPGGLPYYLLPSSTSPALAPLLRRSGGAGGATAASNGPTTTSTVATSGGAMSPDSGDPAAASIMRSSPFAPPLQLYMKVVDVSKDHPGGPVATVATAAAKAGRVPQSPLSPCCNSSSIAERLSFRVPSLDFGLLRPAFSDSTTGTFPLGYSRDGTAADAAASPSTSSTAAARAAAGLAHCDSDLGQNCQMEGQDDEDGGGGAATTAAAAMTGGGGGGRSWTKPSSDAPRLNSRIAVPIGTPAGPLGGVGSMFKSIGGSANLSAAVAAAAGADGGGTDSVLTEGQSRSRRRSSARGALASFDGEQPGGTSGPYMMGDTTKTLQVGISVAALLEVVKSMPATLRFDTTAKVFSSWMLPPTRSSQCRFLDLVMARVKIVLGEPPDMPQAPPAAGGRASYSGMPVLHPDRTWFGPPDYYVIHSWSGNFVSLVSALKDYCGTINKTPSSTYVWLDIVAANHHPVRKDKKQLPHCKQIMATARKVLLVLDPMAHSLTRLWCLYEIWLAACAIPGSSSPSKLTLLNAGADWDAFADSFFRIDLSRCSTSCPDDRAKLLEDMIRTSHDISGVSNKASGISSSSQPSASGTTISPYGIVAALPQLSAAVRASLFDAAASDVAEARRGARAGGNGMLALLDAVERYAMIRRLAGGHVEAEEQMEMAVSTAMGVSGSRNLGSTRPSSPPRQSASGMLGTAATAAAPAAATAAPLAELTVSSGIGTTMRTAAWTESNDGGGSNTTGEGGDPAASHVTQLPPMSTQVQSSSSGTPNGSPKHLEAYPPQPISPTRTGNDDDGLASAAAAATASSLNASSAALWRKKPATLAALAVLQAEHGRLIQASTHAAMALSCIPGLALVRPMGQDMGDSDDVYDHVGGGSGRYGHHGGAGGGGGGGGRENFSLHSTVGSRSHRSGSPPPPHALQTSRSRYVTYDNGINGGGDSERKSHGGQGRNGASGSGSCGGGGGGTAQLSSSSSPPPAPGEISWKGSYWELSSPQNITSESCRAILMASAVESASGRHEAAAQLALQAGLARAVSLGPAHPATLAAKRAAVTHLLSIGRVVDAQQLAKSLLREALQEHGDVHPSVGICHGAVAMVLAAQNKAELAYSSAQRGAEVLAASLGRSHPATLDALQLCADMLESAREYGKAVALMRIVVQGRSVPGAIRASPASPAFLAPNNRLLHLRTIAALEEKAMSEEHSRRALISVMRSLARLESELRAALTAMTGAAAHTQLMIQRDLEAVLLAQNKRYEAAMLRKGELRPP